MSAAISACEKGSQWPMALRLLAASMEKNVISYSAAMSACAKGMQWQHASCFACVFFLVGIGVFDQRMPQVAKGPISPHCTALCVCVFVCLFVCLGLVCPVLSPCLPVSLSLCLSVSLFVCVCVTDSSLLWTFCMFLSWKMSSILKAYFCSFVLLFPGEALHFSMLIMLQTAHLWNQNLKSDQVRDLIFGTSHCGMYVRSIFGLAFFLGLRCWQRLCCYWRTWSCKTFRAAGLLVV